MIRYALTLALAASAVPALADHGTTFDGKDEVRATEYDATPTATASTSSATTAEGTAVAAAQDYRSSSDRALGESPLARQMDFGG